MCAVLGQHRSFAYAQKYVYTVHSVSQECMPKTVYPRSTTSEPMPRDNKIDWSCMKPSDQLEMTEFGIFEHHEAEILTCHED